MRRRFIIGTAGHVDHGKSALVKALTGTEPDRLPEEKARGITIELGFARLVLPGPDSSDMDFDIGIVDVPGHEDFVRNMVAGVGAIDLALLVVAADDGWMPQTEEHLQILAYVGVPRAVVAVTKSELPGVEADTKMELVREKLRNSPFEHAPIVQTSVITGAGLEDLKTAIMKALDVAAPPRDIGKPRLALDRVFKLRGIGTVVTGTLRGGSLHQMQQVCIQPGASLARIRTVQSHNQSAEWAEPGMRTALNLVDFQPGKASGDKSEQLLRRGCLVTLPGLGEAHNLFDVLLERSSRRVQGARSAGRPLKSGARVRLHCGTENVAARVYLESGAGLEPGGKCVAQLRLEAAVFAFAGERFVLRDWAQQVTLAGGTILDPCASRKWFRSSTWRALFADAGEVKFTAEFAITAKLYANPVLKRSGLLAQSIFSESEIGIALAQLTARGKCVLLAGYVVESGEWTRWKKAVHDLVSKFHQEHPERPGVPLEALRSNLTLPVDPAGLFESLISELSKDGFCQINAVLRRKGFQPTLPGHLRGADARIRSVLVSKPLDPPSRKELAADRAGLEALAFLLRTGELVELSQELVISSGVFAKTVEAIRKYLGEHRAATVSELRQALGVSRRVAIPLLEKLDRDGVTRRDGDKRSLRGCSGR